MPGRHGRLPGMRFPGLLSAASVLAFVSVSGCVKPVPLEAIDTSVTRYRAPELDAPTLRESGVAVLPISASDAANAAAAQRMTPDLVAALERRGVCAAVIAPDEVRARFDRAGVTLRFEKMVARLPVTERLDRDVLDEMGQATGCRFFLQAVAVSDSSTSHATPNGIPHTSHAVTTELHAQLWDAATGEVVWEGTGAGAALLGDPHYGSHNQTEWYATRGVANRLGQDPSEQPRPRTVAELHEHDHAQVQSVSAENQDRAEAATLGLYVLAEVLAALAD